MEAVSEPERQRIAPDGPELPRSQVSLQLAITTLGAVLTAQMVLVTIGSGAISVCLPCVSHLFTYAASVKHKH